MMNSTEQASEASGGIESGLGEAPLTGLMAVGSGELAQLEPGMRLLAANTVLPGTHFCFVAAATLAPAEHAELERLVHLLDGRRPWSILRSAAGGDFARVLMEVAARHPGEDIAVIAPQARLPYAWDARLRKAVRATPGIGAAIPLCDIEPMFALLDEEARAGAALDAALIDRTAYCMGDRSYYEIARIHPVCAYLRRDALEAALPQLLAGDAAAGNTGAQAVLDRLARRWRALGWSCVICDYLYVGYSGVPAARAAASQDLEERAWLRDNPLGTLRRAVNDAIRKGLPPVSVPGLDHRPVQLHIMHFWGGGLERWVRDFGRANPETINMILATFRIGEAGGQRLVLYSDPAALLPVRTWDIARPIRSSAPVSLEYRRILEQIVAEFNVEAVIVSSLIGHALDALNLPLKTVVVCHDFYPICQVINPQFGTTCERCTLEDLRLCASSNPLNNIFVDQTSDEWHAMRGRYVEHLLARRIELVVPSPSVATTLRRIEPRLQQLPIHVIAHGLDWDVAKLQVAPRDAAEPLRIVVLGRLSLQKGLQLLRDACDGLRPAEITLVGCGANGVKLAQECGWKSIERYEPDELPGLLRSIAPHAGLLATVVPETFSYTLSELMALGVPPLATALGSFRDRIIDGETGLLFEPTRDALVELVRKLHAQPELLERVARNLAALPPGRSTAAMVNDYRALLPLAPRPVARFRVGVGRQTGLTEPYRHLSESYAQLTDAYAHGTKAYEETRVALDRNVREATELKGVLKEWNKDFDALAIRKRWWRAPRAARLVIELRRTLRALEEVETRAPAAPPAAPATAIEPRSPAPPAPMDAANFPCAERLWPQLLKSPWWIGHIPFAYELVARLQPKVIVELGTYSGSSFAAFCQAVEACALDAHCYGIDLWEGDIHMGTFDASLFEEISGYLAKNYPGIATLVRKDFNEAAAQFAPGSIDLLHIDGTHTYEAVSNDFHTWRSRLSKRAVVLFHDVNVTVENAGAAARNFGVRRFFDEQKGRYAHLEFAHCWGLGVLIVGEDAPAPVMQLVEMARDPGFEAYFAAKGARVTQHFEDLGVELPVHSPYSTTQGPWRRSVNKLHRIARRLRHTVMPT